MFLHILKYEQRFPSYKPFKAHTPFYRYRLTKNGFAGPKSFRASRNGALVWAFGQGRDNCVEFWRKTKKLCSLCLFTQDYIKWARSNLRNTGPIRKKSWHVGSYTRDWPDYKSVCVLEPWTRLVKHGRLKKSQIRSSGQCCHTSNYIT